MSHLVEDDNISNSDTDENTPLLAENYINDSWKRRLVMVRSKNLTYSVSHLVIQTLCQIFKIGFLKIRLSKVNTFFQTKVTQHFCTHNAMFLKNIFT